MKSTKIIFLSAMLAAMTASSCTKDRPEFKERPVVTPPAPTENFASGADISGVIEFEQRNVKFYNKAGEEKECTAIMKELGMNAIRLRVFVDHKAGLCGKDDILEMGRRAHELGMRLMIDFHYSDDFADPGKQTIPAAWQDYDYEQMKKAVADHTTDILSALKDEGIDVEWVQVGNETRGGMLWPMGNADENMNQYAGLTQAGYDAVKSVYPDAQVIVHIDKGAEYNLYLKIFDGLQRNHAKWDIIGMSFYPDIAEWRNQTDDLTENVIKLSERYGTPCMVVETGMEQDQPATAKEFLTYLFDRMINGTKGFCRGILYWEPETYPGTGSGYNKGAFSNEGKPTEALDPFDMSQYE